MLSDKTPVFWIDPKNEPIIIDQSKPVYPNYKTRINTFWKSFFGYRKPSHIFDHQLLTIDEIKHFDSNIKPVWFDNLTVEMVKDIFELPNINSFEFLESLPNNGDCVITTNDGKNLIIFHDIVSDTFSRY